ncbi:hypothetical protein K6U20_11900 [Vibrio fluvialis]|uniref:hypothetical protein n=1 Tax=Vibrio fluvialis TaxID=676 RepID=UPI001F30B663|nr:hypothetical protein [Vibrio fluvialis]MCE7580960.1 hypothetical protein [Vibrio fluvialis]MCG6405326.1 hypothetical protein [Vibrio fluvialis]
MRMNMTIKPVESTFDAKVIEEHMKAFVDREAVKFCFSVSLNQLSDQELAISTLFETFPHKQQDERLNIIADFVDDVLRNMLQTVMTNAILATEFGTVPHEPLTPLEDEQFQPETIN